MMNYRNWTSNTLTEEDFSFYWKYVLEAIFRESPIVLKRGESYSMSSKSERQINEYEYGESSKSIYGRKIDLIFAAPVVNNALQEELIELGALEIRPASVSESVEAVQLNKNIRVNKSIFHNIHFYVGNYFIDGLCMLGVDVLGLSAYIYKVKQFEDITTACKVSKESIFFTC
ncbi:uncharacterized protein B0P05DRAFT_26902 [Gilbertella persicaria]|uniref:uncharacterized protein n=1 Tax=Gilbertella persicaria TaxID=101096 RepID=UPI00221FD9C3|nr:uncharacterized protein B0P05DRAFT_26902 [Gilbertella persicaria]KAI8085914.1 hypothetical protein B0P05DRAFT_26902 [Gilbertella persicaria]